MTVATFPWSTVGSALAGAVAAVFAALVLARWRRASDALWGAGLALYAVAALLEAGAAGPGWSTPLYKAYFAASALTVGFLALGTLALLARPRVTRVAAATLAVLALVLVTGVAATPLDATSSPADVGAGLVPFPHPARVAFLLLNVLGGLALVGGALASGWTSRRPGVLLIGAGALLPFVGGSLAALDVAPVRVALQLAGISLMFAGYVLGRRAPLATRAPVAEAA